MPDAPVRQPQTEKKKKRSCLGCLLQLVVVAVVLGAIAGGGYYALLKGYVSQRTVLKLAGKAPGQIDVLNVSADNMSFSAVEAGKSEGFLDSNGEIAHPSESISLGGLKPGRYTVHLASSGKTPKEVSCTILIGNADVYRFVFSDGPVLVFHGNVQPASKKEADAMTSSLCKQ